MCSPEVELCVFDPSILRGFMLLFSNPNGGLKMAIGLSVEGLPRPFELHG
jgi:hypothetical protein